MCKEKIPQKIPYKTESLNLRKEQAENTKQRLLDCARMQFAEKGYKGTSVRSVNRKLGLADGILYHYFPGGKKEIFQTIVTQNFQKVAEEITEKHCEDCKNLPLEKIMLIAFHQFTKTVDNNIDIIRIILKENEVAEVIPKKNIFLITDCVRKHISDLLKAKAEMGEIKEMDYDSGAKTIMFGFINYILISAMELYPEGKPDDEKIKTMIRYYINLWKK